LQLQLARRGDDARGKHVAAQDASEDVDEDAAHFLIAGEDFEGVLHLVGGGAAADVEKVGRSTAGKFDDVHGGHGKAGAIDHAADGAVELDVVELVIRSFHFERVFFVKVAQLEKILVAIEGVVVEIHFGVERDQAAVAGNDERVDFRERGVGFGEGAIERLQKGHGGLRLFGGEAEAKGELS